MFSGICNYTIDSHNYTCAIAVSPLPKSESCSQKQSWISLRASVPLSLHRRIKGMKKDDQTQDFSHSQVSHLIQDLQIPALVSGGPFSVSVFWGLPM